MRRLTTACAIVVACAGAGACAEVDRGSAGGGGRAVAGGGEGGGGGGGGARVPRVPGGVEGRLIPVEVVLAHGREVGVSAEVEAAIRADVARTQGEWDHTAAELRVQTAELERALVGERVDEAEVAREAADVVRLEGELKQQHLALLVRVRNALTEEQRVRLGQLRSAE